MNLKLCSTRALLQDAEVASASWAPPNPSIERTNNGGRGCAVLRASRAPLFAAHVERWPSWSRACHTRCAQLPWWRRAACRSAARVQCARRRMRAGRSVLRRPAHQLACVTGAAPPSRRAVRPLAASARSGVRALLARMRKHGRIVNSAALGAAWRFAPAPASTQRPTCRREGWCFATAGIGHAAHAGGCFGAGSWLAQGRRAAPCCLAMLGCLRIACAMTANPSIERTSKRLRLFAAAHVER
jgi:hypothetical protein